MPTIKEILEKKWTPEEHNKELLKFALRDISQIEEDKKGDRWTYRYNLYKRLISLICGWDAQSRNPAYYDQELYDKTMEEIVEMIR